MFEFTTVAGQVKAVSMPAGAPRGFDALRPGATVEHLGGGLRPLVASAADLITMAAARGLPKDLALVPRLQPMLQFEASLARIVETRPAGGRIAATLVPVTARLSVSTESGSAG